MRLPLLVLGIVLASQICTSNGQQLPTCTSCSGLSENDCGNTFGCLWSDVRSSCGNGCEYDDSNTCDGAGGCPDQCRWISGVFETCIVKWDFSFDVCFVVDDSQSITGDEWEVIRSFFIIGVIESISPSSCDLENPRAEDNCPGVGIVQFNFKPWIVFPKDIAGTYGAPYTTAGQGSVCFDPSVVLGPVPDGWRTDVLNMERGIIRNPVVGGGTFTLHAVTRCADLLYNSWAANPKTLSLLVTMTDGNPNGPTQCGGQVCSVCERDTEHYLNVFRRDPTATHPECLPGVALTNAQVVLINRPQRQKIIDAGIKTLLVLFKFGVGAFVSTNNIGCLVNINTPLDRKIEVSAAALATWKDNAASRAELVNDVANISNTFCEFQTQAPTRSPTESPTRSPTDSPTESPTESPTKGDTDPPTTSPTESPTESPTQSPSIADTTARPTQEPTDRPTPGGCSEPMPSNPFDKSCKDPCDEDQVAEWETELVKHEYDADDDVTVFKYCVSYDSHWYSQSNACIAKGKMRTSGVSHITFRLDKCCDVCLSSDHFYHSSGMSITNYGESAYFKIDRGSDCYYLKMNGNIGSEMGKVCVKGATKCACTAVQVPSSCDLKEYLDADCDSSSSSSGGSGGGKMGGSGGKSGGSGGKMGGSGGSRGGSGGKMGGSGGSGGKMSGSGGKAGGGGKMGGSGGSRGGGNTGNGGKAGGSGGNGGKAGGSGGNAGGNGGKGGSGGRSSRGGGRGGGNKDGNWNWR